MTARPAGRAPVAVFDNYWAATLAFVRSLGRQGVPLHCYGKGAVRWSRYSAERRDCPAMENTREFLPWLREKIRSGEIARIAPTTDLIAYYCSLLRAEFPAEVARTIAPLEEIETCLIKTRFASACARHGQPSLAMASPDSMEGVSESAAALGFPLMLKPKSHLAIGFEHRGRLLHDEAELKEHYRPYAVSRGQESIEAAYPELTWPLLQRYLPSARQRVYSVSGYKDADGGVIVATLSYKREQWPPDVGVSTVQIAYEDQRILGAGLRAIEHMLSRGIFEVELLEEGKELFPIDLNPRAFGFMELDMARGADLPWLWYRSTHEVLRPFPAPSSHVGMVARHRFRYLLNALLRRPRRRKPSEERRDPQKPRSSVSMLGHWSDPLPMILSNLQLLRHPRSLLRSQLASVQGSAQPGQRIGAQ